MQEFLNVTGMVIHSDPSGEYDRRIVILTKNSGKISAFAKGARRPNSKFLAATDLFSFGEFKLYVGRESYSLMDTNITNHFEDIRNDLSSSLYGMYFLEVCEYNTRENNDEYEILRLLYASVKALLNNSIPKSLVKLVFELKFFTLMGQFAVTDEYRRIYKASTIYTLDFIIGNKSEKLYSFIVKDDVLQELLDIAKECKRRIMPHVFKSEEMLSVVEM